MSQPLEIDPHTSPASRFEPVDAAEGGRDDLPEALRDPVRYTVGRGRRLLRHPDITVRRMAG